MKITKKLTLFFQARKYQIFLLMITIISLSIVVPKVIKHRLASSEGFENMDSVWIDGTDGKKYKVDIFWNDLHRIPGQHKIKAKIWLSEFEFRDQSFTSGNRLELKTIGVKKKNGPDILILNFSRKYGRKYGRKYKSFNTVSAAGIDGHPQKVEAQNKRASSVQM